MPQFVINVIADERPNRNGRLTPRVVLEVDGEQRAVQRINIESDMALVRTAKAWSKEFEIDQTEIMTDLRALGVEVVSEAAEHRKRLDAAPQATRRISQLADEFLGTLEPEWHRKHKAIYFAGLGREVALGSLWTLLSDKAIDGVFSTVEAHEAARDGSPPHYRWRLATLKEAVSLAGSRLVTRLPDLKGVAHDPTVDKQELLDQIVQWFLRERTFRADNGNPISVTYHSWCAGLEPGEAWCQCFSAPVFARVGVATGLVRVAVRGRALAADLHYDSSRKLAADLRHAGFADIGTVIKVTAVAWRTWQFTPVVIESITGGNAK